MKKLWLILLSTALLFSLCGMTAFAIVGTASAHVAQRNLPQVSCSGNRCDGQDPVTTGCSNDARTVLIRVSANRDATVELRYSDTCKTNWGRVTSNIGPTHLMVSVQRGTDGRKYTSGSGGNKVPWLWSPMVYAPTAQAQACGGVNTPNTCTGYR